MVRIRERDLGELTELGTIVGLCYEDDEHGFEVAFDDVVLFWSSRAQALVWWDGAEDPPELEEPTAADLVGEHADTWRTWTRGAEVDGGVEAHTPATNGRPRDIGQGVWVDYDSAKFGKLDLYRHRFGPGVMVASTGEGEVVLWVVQGGGLHITEQGLIEG